MTKKVPDSLLAAIRRSSNIVLATHVNPDGDALGSLLGFAIILEKMGKRVHRFVHEAIPGHYGFLPHADRLCTSMEDLHAFAESSGGDILLVALDCGDRKRLGDVAETLLALGTSAVIDHHLGNEGFGDIHWIEPDRSSTGEMIYDLAEALGREVIRPEADALYAAIVSDTGSFKYASTSVHTFEVARKLVLQGVRPEKIVDFLFDNFTTGRLRLLQQVLASLQLFADETIAVIRVTREMLEQTGTSLEDTENFINMPRSVETVQVAVLLKEAADNGVSVSLRAKGRCDVARVCALFGGGGHRNAAGFRRKNTTTDAVLEQLLPELRAALQQ